MNAALRVASGVHITGTVQQAGKTVGVNLGITRSDGIWGGGDREWGGVHRAGHARSRLPEAQRRLYRLGTPFAEEAAELGGFGDAKAGVEVQGVAGVVAGQADVAKVVVGLREAALSASLFGAAARRTGQGQCGAVVVDGLGRITHGARGFTEAVERLGLIALVAKFTKQVQGLPVMGARLLVPALPPVYQPKVAERGSFAAQGTEAAIQLQGLPVVRVRLLVAALPLVDQPEVAQHVGFAEPLADLAVDIQGTLVAVEGPVIVTLPQVLGTKAVPGPGLAKPLTGCAGQIEGLLRELGCVLLATLPPVGHAEVEQRVDFGRFVAAPPACVQGLDVQDQCVRVLGMIVEVAVQGGRQPAGVRRPGTLGGVDTGGDEVGAFGIQPRCRVRGAGEADGGGFRFGDPGPELFAVRVNKINGCGRGVQVVVEEPGKGIVPGPGVFAPGYGATGMLPQQVVEGIAPRLVLQQDMDVQEVFQEHLGGLRCDDSEGGGRVGADVTSWVQAKQPEHALLVRLQLLIGHAERGRDAPLGGGQLGQPAALVT